MKFIAIAAVLAIPCLALAAPYTGATAQVFDIAGSDVPGPEPIRVFPVPAAAGWSAPQLVFDNWGAGLTFSTTEAASGYQYYGLPISNSQVTIHGITNSISPPPTLSDTYSFYTNTEGSASDPNYVNDNRFPYHLPRLARSHGESYLSVEFDLATPVQKLGLFLPASSNTWGDTPGSFSPQNFQLQDRSVYVYIMSASDTLGTAQVIHQTLTVSGTGTYCPFLEINWNGTDLIKSIAIIHDGGENADKGVGFMDMYVNVPEPASMTLLLASAVGLCLRKRRR